MDLSLKQIKVTGKRNKQRFIPFGDKLKSDLNAYLSVREERFPGGGEAFFSSWKWEADISWPGLSFSEA